MDKKKVGVITFHRAINYGAAWQTYALLTHLQSKGFLVEVIDYFPNFLQKYHYKLPKNPLNFIKRLGIIPQFNKFVKKRLTLTTCYKTESELEQNPPQADFYVCGSDQIWNREITGNELKPYLLTFVPVGKKKISYAASIGSKKISKQDEILFSKEFPKFSALSVREKLLQEEVKRLSDREADIVLDPTFLLNKADYCKLLSFKKKLQKPYILRIDLEGNALMEDSVMHLKKKTGLSVVNISGSYCSYADKNPLYISPEDWLNYILNAAYICTNSFHGLAFSIIFEKNFYCISRKEKNNRATGMLESLDISDRFIKNIEDIDVEKQIDYAKVAQKLELLRSKSFDFLDKALN